MPDCNIRNIGNDLLKRMKTDAASRGMTLRAWCRIAFESNLTPDNPWSMPPAKPAAKPDTSELIRLRAGRLAAGQQGPGWGNFDGLPHNSLVPEVGVVIHPREKHAKSCSCFICQPPKEK